MKKRYLVFFTLVLSICLTTPTIYARAGGGSGSGGGGGGSSSSHSNHSSNRSSNHSYITGFVVLGTFSLFVYAIKKYDVIVLSSKNRKKLKNSARQDPLWNEDTVIARIEEIYYKVQVAWSDKDLVTLKKYLTPSLFEEWKLKLEWDEYRYQQNILESIRLLDQKIIFMNDDIDDTKDYFIAYIQGKIKDYVMDTIDHTVIRENEPNFVEYWRFIRIDNNFYLDAVFQEDEINIKEFKEDNYE